jgi:hypothetical protein
MSKQELQVFLVPQHIQREIQRDDFTHMVLQVFN